MSDFLPQYSIAQAREQLTQLVHQAEQGNPVELTRRGKRVAVILSAIEYDRLSQKGGFGKSLAAFRERLEIEKVDINPDEVFRDVRDRSPGREVIL
ncbi:MAG TPA: type II toxin-antitoxin system prevent-host-death family antitoxin [Coleofasciculaceae cyanobacterium]|jgi:prevent-host-death family protein